MLMCLVQYGKHLSKDSEMARNNDRRTEYSIQEVENGYIVIMGPNINHGGYGKQFVFNTIKEVNDFIAKQNQEVLV